MYLIHVVGIVIIALFFNDAASQYSEFYFFNTDLFFFFSAFGFDPKLAGNFEIKI